LRRRPVLGWVFYDWANSAFATTVMAGFFPVFFKQYWSVGADPTVSTFRLGLGNGVASLVIALLAPLLGAMADRGGTRVRSLALFTVLGASATAAMYLVEKGDWGLAIFWYCAASLGFAGGIAFYDSLLLDVVEGEEEIDLISAYGYSAGYLGGGLLFALNVAMTLKPAVFGLEGPAEGVRLSFVMVAVWWVVFAIPVVLFVREKKPTKRLGALEGMRAGWRELFHTLASLRRYKTIALFLGAYWLYIDGVNTVIKMAVDYGLSLGFEASSLIVALLITQFVGFPAAIVFGWLGKRFGPKGAIQAAILVYFGITIWAYWLDNVKEFYAMAIVIGLVQGGIQSLSRSLFGRLVPPDKAGEFFGFFNMMGKFAAVIGPILTGGVALLTGSSRLAILSLVILFALGSLLLHRVRLTPAGEGA